MSYWEWNSNIFFALSVLSLYDRIYIFSNFFLRLFPIRDILQNFQVRLFSFPWCYLVLLVCPSIPWIIFIIVLDALPTTIALLLFFVMDILTRHIFRLRLLLPSWPILLYHFYVLLDTIQCDKMRNELWGGSNTASLNIIFLWSVDFFLFNWELLTWGWIIQLSFYHFSVSFRVLLHFWWTDNWLMWVLFTLLR